MFKYSPIRMSPLRRSGVANWNLTPDTPTVTINSNTSLTIDWVITGLDKTVTAVELWHSTDGTTYTRLVKLGAVATYDHAGLENNSIHYYKVRYWSGMYVSGFSGVVSARTINYVDYIQSSGTQYINTGIKTTNFNVSLKAIVSAVSSGILGVELDTNNRFNVSVFTTNGHIRTNNTLKSTAYTLDTDLIVIISNGSASLNGVDLSPVLKSFTNTLYNEIVFGYNITGTPSNLMTGKIYYIDRDTYYNYKPCLNLSGQFCMFDEVSKTYKTNAGTGIFTGGGLTTAEIDAALIQYAADGVASVTIDFRGEDNGYRSIASDAAVATLVAAGCTVYVNDIVSDSLAFFIDPSNTLSYPGTGTTVNDLSANEYDGTIENNVTLGDSHNEKNDYINISLGFHADTFGSEL